MTTNKFPLNFESAEERSNFLKTNADYYTITWRQNRQNKRFEYDTLETARFQAQFAANLLKRHISIYGVVCPFSDVNEPYGFSSWVETVKPNVSQHSSPNLIDNA